MLWIAIKIPTSAGDRPIERAIAGASSQIALGAQSLARWPKGKTNKVILGFRDATSKDQDIYIDTIWLVLVLYAHPPATRILPIDFDNIDRLTALTTHNWWNITWR